MSMSLFDLLLRFVCVCFQVVLGLSEDRPAGCHDEELAEGGATEQKADR